MKYLEVKKIAEDIMNGSCYVVNYQGDDKIIEKIGEITENLKENEIIRQLHSLESECNTSNFKETLKAAIDTVLYNSLMIINDADERKETVSWDIILK